MLMPKRVKHRKVMRGRMSGLAKGGHTVAFGDFGLATMEPAWITSRQIEAARRAMTRYVKRGGQIWIRVFPDKPVTKKPAETRRGSGKGNPEGWGAGQFRSRCSPNKPVTKKPAETRMGSGKGNPEGWVAVVKPGRVLFEMGGIPEDLAKEAMRLAGHKLPMKTKFVGRESE